MIIPNELFYASLDAQAASSCTDTSRIVKNRTLPKKQWQFKRDSGTPSVDAIQSRIHWTTSFCPYARFQMLFVLRRCAPICPEFLNVLAMAAPQVSMQLTVESVEGYVRNRGGIEVGCMAGNLPRKAFQSISDSPRDELRAGVSIYSDLCG
jgi:hypothetical protein